jgi:hypothetical protein
MAIPLLPCSSPLWMAAPFQPNWALNFIPLVNPQHGPTENTTVQSPYLNSLLQRHVFCAIA